MNEFETEVLALADALRRGGMRIATAESCTGGLIAAACTSVAGSSDWFELGFVTYSNEAKTEMLDVSADVIAALGAVSGEVAGHMAAGALSRSRADLAVSVTGVAGPGGGSPGKPVGLVWFGVASRDGPARTESQVFPGDRGAIRRATVLHGFALLRRTAGQEA